MNSDRPPNNGPRTPHGDSLLPPGAERLGEGAGGGGPYASRETLWKTRGVHALRCTLSYEGRRAPVQACIPPQNNKSGPA